MTFAVKPPKEVTFHIQLVSMLRWCLDTDRDVPPCPERRAP